MAATPRRSQSGQAIVLVALVMVALFGFLGLAMDGGRGYLDRRQLQAAVDAAALAAAFRYMNAGNSAQLEETAAATVYASNERLYASPLPCSYGASAATCTWSDSTHHALTIVIADHSVAGVSFTVTGSHSIPVTIMQVLGSGPLMRISAGATAVARKQGTKGAAIQTLSPAGCGGNGGNSLSFSGTSTTTVSGDVWSNGSITDNNNANGSVDGNVTDICPAMPPSPIPQFTVTGSQVNGWYMPDPGFTQPTLNATSQTWSNTSLVQQPGTYAADPKLGNGAGCFFLAGGVYTWQSGFTFNGGFISNELRPPDEPNMVAAGTANTTTLSANLTGTRQTTISVSALAGAVPAGSTVVAAGQTFVTSAAAAASATSISINRQDVAGTIPSGTLLSIRALPQFWDANGVACSSSFTLTSPGSGNFSPGTYSIEVTAVRWAPNGVPSCTGPVSPSCFERESAPSMCRTITLASSGNVKVAVSPADPGAQDYNVYLAQNGSCGGLTYCTNFGNGSTSVTINNNCAAPPQPGPPDGEGLPLGAGLPNSDPRAGTPPHGDLANEGHCVNPVTGGNSACPGTMTPGAVSFYIPGGGNTSTCLNLQGGGDIYVFSGYQYNRVLLYEPGAEQLPPANTCPNGVAGHGLTSLIGIFYVPAAAITITGNSSFLATIAGGVIAWTANVKGNGGVSISVDPSLRTWPSAVRLTQ